MTKLLRRLGLAKERRSEERLKLTVMVVVGISRHQGTLLDISRKGASVQSFAATKPEERVLFTLRFRNLKIELNGIVRGCRVVAINPRPTYISRLQFTDVSETARQSLDEFMRMIEEVGKRTWKRTKEGYSRRNTGTPRAIIAVYTQLVKRDSNWEEILVFDPDQPDEDGVTLPSGTPTAEIAHFCELYDAADKDGRTLLRQQAETLCSVNADAH
ncbi:MAG TPA: PilZ domain-containing protein [Thermoanaerobaculia bacterium]|nr:PilZ domain-containing protein [Thermoanaerobaculia bacterium]